MEAIQRVLRWKGTVRNRLEAHGLGALSPAWCLAQIHTESRGYVRPEAVYGDHFGAEGMLQMYAPAASDAGYTQDEIDGDAEDGSGGTVRADAVRSIDAWAKLGRRYVGKPQSVALWDYPLLWFVGSGVLSTSRGYRESGVDYWGSWLEAVGDHDSIGYSYFVDYVSKYWNALVAYWRAVERGTS